MAPPGLAPPLKKKILVFASLEAMHSWFIMKRDSINIYSTKCRFAEWIERKGRCNDRLLLFKGRLMQS